MIVARESGVQVARSLHVFVGVLASAAGEGSRFLAVLPGTTEIVKSMKAQLGLPAFHDACSRSHSGASHGMIDYFDLFVWTLCCCLGRVYMVSQILLPNSWNSINCDIIPHDSFHVAAVILSWHSARYGRPAVLDVDSVYASCAPKNIRPRLGAYALVSRRRIIIVS